MSPNFNSAYSLQKRKRSNQRGAQAPEFAAALTVLLIGVFLPLLDLGIIPVRWLLSKEIIQGYTRKLALSENFTQALAILEADPSLETRLIHLGGVKPQARTCQLVISQLKPPLGTFTADKPHMIPPEWLPGGKNSPCSYEVDLSMQVDFDPLFTINLGGAEIPGLTKPFTTTINARSAWENFGCNPVTKQFYINE
jgi:hypothetical protein